MGILLARNDAKIQIHNRWLYQQKDVDIMWDCEIEKSKQIHKIYLEV